LLAAQNAPSSCASCAVWNKPQVPFRIYGNSFYVGTEGLSSVLITSDAGHVLLDGALPESAPLIAANIRSLGFRLEDIKLILNSHAHFDHAGGLAELQRLTGARVAASRWSAEVLRSGVVARDDPQFGILIPVARLPQVDSIEDGATLRVGRIALTATLTPGHTPGGTSWLWQSCESTGCLTLVYADSLSPVSAKGFRFSDNTTYRGAIQDFERSFAFLESTPCDIVITPHPDLAALQTTAPRSPNPCRALAARGRQALQDRLQAEASR
jgi:metallo-beta-lactamase class B